MCEKNPPAKNADKSAIRAVNTEAVVIAVHDQNVSIEVTTQPVHSPKLSRTLAVLAELC